MGKALSGELSCPCDRSCYLRTDAWHPVLRPWIGSAEVPGGGDGGGVMKIGMQQHVFYTVVQIRRANRNNLRTF